MWRFEAFGSLAEALPVPLPSVPSGVRGRWWGQVGEAKLAGGGEVVAGERRVYGEVGDGLEIGRDEGEV